MEEVVTWVFVLVVFLGPMLVRLIRGIQQQQPAVDGSAEAVPVAAAPPAAARLRPAPRRAAPAQPGAGLSLAQVVEKLEASRSQALELAKGARLTRPTRRFVEPLEGFVVTYLDSLLAQARGSTPPHPSGIVIQLSQLELVLGQLESFVVQRQNPDLAATLGDADAFAISCFEPFAEFARAHSIPLTSNTPVTEFGYDLAIWTAFIPTGIAPIALPTAFFRRIAWWPALAHEIAHDVYGATRGFDQSVRQQLGVVPAHVGSAPLRFGYDGLASSELSRIFGGWFEELFCDVFGTLMCGPAYVWTMLELFGDPSDPSSVLRVHLDASRRRYDEHPPRHLRLCAACEVLEQLGHSEEAEQIRAAWAEVHGGDLSVIIFPASGQYVGLPAEPLESHAVELAAKLYTEQLQALSSYRLSDIPGLDFGPHLSAESERARDRLLAGVHPQTTDARAVISGAVLAWLQQPDDEQRIIQLARGAVKAHGTFEAAPDRYAEPPAPGDDDRREAFILHTIFSPPPSLVRLGMRKPGGLVRRPASASMR